MIFTKENNNAIITLQTTQEIMSFKRLLQHAMHDIKIFNLGAVPHLQQDLKLLEELSEKI